MKKIFTTLFMAAMLLVEAVDDLKEDLLIVHQIGKAVGAQKHAVSPLHIQMGQVAGDHTLRTNGTGDEVFTRITFRHFRL